MKYLLTGIIFFFNSILLAGKGEYKFEGYRLVNNFYYSDKFDFLPQNWSIIQDSKGIIYFANTGGILEHDGFSWNKINIPNGIVRSLSINNSGNIYAGGMNEFGYLTNDTSYSLVYHSLVNKLASKNRNFSSVYQIYENTFGVYFRTSKSLFRLNKNNLTELNSSSMFMRILGVDNNIYVGEKDLGLKKVDKDKLKLIQGGDFFAKDPVRIFLKLNNEEYFIATRNNSFFIYDGLTFTPFHTEVENFIKEYLLYDGILLSDGNIAIATLRGGVVIFNQDGKLVDIINESNGIQDNNVKYIYQDSQDNIWLALNNGISKIEYSSPFKVFDKRMGLDGIVLSITKFNDNLYAGTTSGLYNLPPINTFDISSGIPGFKKNDFINSIVWSLLPIDDNLIAGCTDGIYLINTNNKSSKISAFSTYVLHKPGDNNNLIILGTIEGVAALYRDEKKWLEYKLYNNINSRITTITGSVKNEIWVGTSSAGVFRISKPAAILDNIINKKNPILNESFITQFDSSYGLPPGETNVFKISGRYLFATTDGIYKFNVDNQKFIPDTTFGTMFAGGSRLVFKLIEDENKNVWIDSEGENFLAEYQNDGSYSIISKPFLRFKPTTANDIFIDGDKTWFGQKNSEIIQFNKKKKKNFNTGFYALIRKVFINSDSLIYGGAPLPEDFKPLSLSYENRNLRFQYACTFYEEEERTEFQYKLEGYDDDWSTLQKETQKDYTNLQEGTYTFNVRANNIYGDISKTAAYSFKILPPLYRTIWAYLLYAILLLSFGFVIVKWRINKLEKERERLSQLVNEKTGEVQKQNVQLSEQAEKLKELDKIKSRFFANISHEFRTPLTLILGPTKQMMKKERPAGEKKDLLLILRNSKKLLSLINQLLDVSKLESGKMQLLVRKVNFVRFIREITLMFESLADRKKINLGFYFEQEELELYCDTDKIEKVIVNLLSNAFKFTKEKGEVTVIISKEGETESSGYVKIMVMDTGIGISEENLKNIFDPFYQADASTKREYEGTGIGLSLVKEFVELHKGSVTVESSEGKGTKFIIKLPLGDKHFNPDEIISENFLNESEDDSFDQIDAVADLEEEFSGNGDSEELNKSEQSNGKETILVVDDNKDVRNYIKDYLEKGYKIIEASDGAEGLAKAKEIFPDLIVSDVMMPKMDGFELCENIKKDVNTSHIPVILLTAKAGDENVMQGLETGADDYITKPFNVEILLQRIKNLIELRKQLQQKYQKQLFLQPAEIKVTSVDETFLKKLQELAEENLSDPDFNIENLTDKFNMSYASMFRKIKALTGEPPVKFLRSYRLKRAAQLLKAKSGNITEIAFSVGFNNSAYFTKCFKEQFNRLPSEYQSVES